MAVTILGAQKIAAKKIGISLNEYYKKRELGFKWCACCKQWKSVINFWKDSTRYDKLSSRCNTCQYVAITNNTGKALRRKMKLLSLKFCNVCKKWLPLILVGKSGMCKPHENQYVNSRYENNIYVQIDAKKRSAFRRILEPIPIKLQIELLILFDNICAYCRISKATSWDHVYPICNGGITEKGNILPTCQKCNNSKSGSNVYFWLEKKNYPLYPKLKEFLKNNMELCNFG